MHARSKSAAGLLGRSSSYASGSHFDDLSIASDKFRKDELVEAQPSFLARSPWSPFYYIPSVKNLVMAQASCVCAMAAAAATVAGTGIGLLAFVLLLRTYAPSSVSHVRPLHFDYTKAHAVAVASFATTSPRQTTVPALPGSRTFPTAQQVQVTVHLHLPETPHNQRIFQLTGELVTGDGRVAARSTRSVMLSHRSALVQHIRGLLRLPLVLLGLKDEGQAVAVRLFEAYEEREAFPVLFFRALLAPSFSSNTTPEVYDARLTVRLRLGWGATIMYYLRPGLLTTACLSLTAVALIASGTTALAALLLAASLLFSISRALGGGGHRRLGGEPPLDASYDEDAADYDSLSTASLAGHPKGAPLPGDEDSGSNSVDWEQQR